MLLGFAAGGATGLFAAMAAWLGVWLATQLYYVLKLARWLESPKINTIPHVGGMWSTIFDTLLRQAKSRKKHSRCREACLCTADVVIVGSVTFPSLFSGRPWASGCTA